MRFDSTAITSKAPNKMSTPKTCRLPSTFHSDYDFEKKDTLESPWEYPRFVTACQLFTLQHFELIDI